jgi:hypothetical protein
VHFYGVVKNGGPGGGRGLRSQVLLAFSHPNPSHRLATTGDVIKHRQPKTISCVVGRPSSCGEAQMGARVSWKFSVHRFIHQCSIGRSGRNERWGVRRPAGGSVDSMQQHSVRASCPYRRHQEISSCMVAT